MTFAASSRTTNLHHGFFFRETAKRRSRLVFELRRLKQSVRMITLFRFVCFPRKIVAMYTILLGTRQGNDRNQSMKCIGSIAKIVCSYKGRQHGRLFSSGNKPSNFKSIKSVFFLFLSATFSVSPKITVLWQKKEVLPCGFPESEHLHH